MKEELTLEKEKIYQTIIVGGGSAGLTAGRYLKDALILDQKKAEDRSSIRCLGMSIKSFDLQSIKPNPSFYCTESYRIERIAPNGKIICKKNNSLTGYVLEKVTLDKFLSSLIKAELKYGRKVVDMKFEGGVWSIFTDKGECFRSRYVIGADGVDSYVRKKIFPENQKDLVFTYSLEYLVEFNKKIDFHTIKIYLDNQKYSNGYAWIFPKSEFMANIGIGGGGDLYKKMDDFLRNKIIKNNNGYKILNKEIGGIASKINNIKLFKSNVFLVGDAAGLADPIFKAGTSQAMLSGKIAAESIIGNKAEFYDAKIKSMPLANQRLTEANKIFYSFDDQTLNDLGDVLEGKGFSYAKTLPGICCILSKPGLRKNFSKLFKFFSIWYKVRDYLW